MGKTITVEVTQDIIDTAIRGYVRDRDNICECCVLAIALSRAVGEPCTVAYREGWLTADEKNTSKPLSVIYRFPAEAVEITQTPSSEWAQIRPCTFVVEVKEMN